MSSVSRRWAMAVLALTLTVTPALSLQAQPNLSPESVGWASLLLDYVGSFVQRWTADPAAASPRVAHEVGTGTSPTPTNTASPDWDPNGTTSRQALRILDATPDWDPNG